MQDSRHNLTVSVIIPTYNCAQFVGAAIESALKQSRPPREVIVVDDGSTDETSDVLRQFGPPVIVVRQANQGQSVARNVALARATGDAIMLLDADDLLLPNCIERTANQLEQQPDVDVVYSDVELVDDAGRRLGVFSEVYPAERPSGRILGSLGYAWSVITPSSTIVRRSALEGIEFDSSLTRSGADDFEFWRRLAAKSRFLYLNEVVAGYRCHGNQMSANRLGDALEGAIEVQQRIMAMPEFAHVLRRNRARLFCHHGARQAMLGRCEVARQMFRRALRTWPLNATAYALFGLSLLGDRALQYAVLKRRELASGNVNRLIAGTAVLPTSVTRPTARKDAGAAAVSAFAEGVCRG